MCQLVAEEELSLDVASGGELYTAKVAGFRPERVYFHGNNKSVDKFKLGLDTGIGTLVVDSFDEITLLDGIAAGRGRRQRVLLRIASGIAPSTHSYSQTGQQDCTTMRRE